MSYLYYMKRISILISTLLLLPLIAQQKLTREISDQSVKQQQKYPSFGKSIFLINGKIGDAKLIDSLNDDIATITVYKSPQYLPERLQPFQDIIENGLLEIRMKSGKTNFPSVSVEQLNRDKGLPADNPFYFDDILIKDSKIEVIESIIKEITVTTNNGKSFISIYTSPKINSEVKF